MMQNFGWRRLNILGAFLVTLLLGLTRTSHYLVGLVNFYEASGSFSFGSHGMIAPTSWSIDLLCNECKDASVGRHLSCVEKIQRYRDTTDAMVALDEAQKIVSAEYKQCAACNPKTCPLATIKAHDLQDRKTPSRKAEEEKGPAIAYLVPMNTIDIEKTKASIRSLDQNLGDNGATPLLLFNEGNLNQTVKQDLTNLTTRKVFFPFVNFTEFPDGFDPQRTRQNFRKRSKWGYWQMCRFWIYKIWQHEILDNYSSVMRMDTDSCFLDKASPVLPRLPNASSHVYVPNQIVKAFTVSQLIETTMKFFNVSAFDQIVPKNPELWERIPRATQGRTQFPAFYTNFEVSKVSFFRQPHIMAFQEAIANKEPFGVFRHQWGDAPVRYLTLALFSEPHEIAFGHTANYGHAGGCTGIHMWPAEA